MYISEKKEKKKKKKKLYGLNLHGLVGIICYENRHGNDICKQCWSQFVISTSELLSTGDYICNRNITYDIDTEP